jgi:hypothetical protein
MSTVLNDLCQQSIKLIDELPTKNGWPLPPKTTNRVRPARSTKSAGWGWTHYFLLGDGSVVGYKLPDNLVFINNWARENLGLDVFHLGRAIPRPDTGEFVFESWAFPITD